MTIAGFELWQIFDIIILLLIGMGPKVAMVPFMEMTAELDKTTRTSVAKQMIKTATVWAIILVIFGAFLMKLLHFSEEALYIAGGIVFVLLAIHMLTAGGKKDEEHSKISKKEASNMANYPLAVPYLLNPVGITMLVIFSASSDSISMISLLIFLVLLMAAFDLLIFTHLDSLIKHIDKSRLAVTEAIFGVLLSALGIELILLGLAGIGVINSVSH